MKTVKLEDDQIKLILEGLNQLINDSCEDDQEEIDQIVSILTGFV